MSKSSSSKTKKVRTPVKRYASKDCMLLDQLIAPIVTVFAIVLTTDRKHIVQIKLIPRQKQKGGNQFRKCGKPVAIMQELIIGHQVPKIIT